MQQGIPLAGILDSVDAMENIGWIFKSEMANIFIGSSVSRMDHCSGHNFS